MKIMNFFLLILLSISFQAICSQCNVDKCFTCSSQSLDIELTLYWPVSYILLKYHKDNIDIVKVKDQLRFEARDSILNDFKIVHDYNVFNHFTIHNFIIVPNECSLFRPNRDNKDNLYLETVDLNKIDDETKECLKVYWPNLETTKQFIDFWNYQWNKHGSCTIDQSKYFKMACDEAKKFSENSKESIKFFVERSFDQNKKFDLNAGEFKKTLQLIPKLRHIRINCLKDLRKSLKNFENAILSITICYTLDTKDYNLTMKSCTDHTRTNCKNNIIDTIILPKLESKEDGLYLNDILIPQNQS